MTLCLQKKETIKSTTMGLKTLQLQWMKAGKISKEDLEKAYGWMRRIERCCNLEKSYGEDS